MLQIRKASDFIPVQTVKILLYGQPGVRKTTFAFTATNSLLLDVDNGVRRVAPMYRGESIAVPTWEKIQEIMKSEEIKKFDHIAIDTAGKLLDLLQAYLIKQNPNLAKGGGFTQQGWGALKTAFNAFLLQVEALNMKGITFIAHDTEKMKGDDSIMRPDISGGSLKILVREMDLVGYIESFNNVATLSFDISDRFWSKNSANVPRINDMSKIGIDDLHRMFFEQQDKVAQLTIDYNEILQTGETIVKTIVGEDTAKLAAIELSKLSIVWDSRLVLQLAFVEALAAVKLKYVKATNSYEVLTEDPADKK